MTQISILSTTENPIKTCAFTGHRLLNDDFSFADLEETVRSLIERGVETFYNGMAVGFDLLCAECVLALKNEFPQIKLIACLPCYGQERNYSEEDKRRYAYILKNADESVLLSENYYKGCMLARDRYMADRADVVIAYHRKKNGGTAYTVNYFQKKYPDREIFFI